MLPDPRVFFAAERTLLAWVRTGTSLMGMGFVLARFGLFLRASAGESLHMPRSGLSLVLGPVFVLLGSAATGLAWWQFVRFLRTLTPEQRAPHHTGTPSAFVAAAVALLGAFLGVYLAASG